MGIFSILTIIFVVLKVLGVGLVATWSWWLVLLPALIGVGLYCLFIVFASIIAILTK
jgi:hypothetical protein